MSFALKIRSAKSRAAEATEALRGKIIVAVEQHIEAQAQALGYGSAASLASYLGSSVDIWQAQARAFVIWRDAVWTAVFALLADKVAAATLTPDTVAASLPLWND
jgi:hypothetical protein